MFKEGKENSSNKMNPSKMREKLVQKYRDRFSIPGETEIRKHITALFQKQKRAILMPHKKEQDKEKKKLNGNNTWSKL